MLTNFFPYVHALVEYLQLRPLTKHRINASKIWGSQNLSSGYKFEMKNSIRKYRMKNIF